MTTQSTVSPLFRREALEFQEYQRQWGDVVLLQPVSTKLLTWSLSVSVAVIVVFLLFAQYARKDTVVGYLTPSAGTAKVFAPQQGVIKNVYVTQGQQVVEGQPLLKVSTNQLAENGEDVNATMLDILASKKAVLSLQIAAEQRRFTSEQQRLSALLGNLGSEASSLDDQIALQKQRIAVGESLVSMASTLAAKGLLSQAERKHREDALLDSKQKLDAMSQQEVSLRDKAVETRYSLEQLETVMSTKLQPLQTELSSTEQRVVEINGHRAYVVRAPITGQVSLVQANVGQTTDPQRLQLEIVPTNSALQAQLFIPARAAGFVQVGQKVRILYDAFPYQKYGTYGGQITELSQTILTGSEISGPVTLKEPMYKVIATLDRPDIDMRGKKMPLRTDMLLKADIVLEKRSLMSWLFEPLLGARI